MDNLISDEIFERVFSEVPQVLKDQILQFRRKHVPKSITIDNNSWMYLDCGIGEYTLVMLPGGLRRPDIGWKLTEQLEKDYRIIAPFYPTTGSMSVLAEGIISILNHENIDKFALIGSSYGGIVLQSILHLVPERVTHAIIANTGTISDDYNLVKLLKRRLKLIRILPGRIVTWIARKAFKRLLTNIEDEKRDVYEAIVDEVFERGWLAKKEFICHFEGLIDFQINHKFNPEDTILWDTKILIIKSSDDPGVIEGASESLDRMYPNAVSHVFLNEGHMPSITRMDEYVKLIHELLKR